MEVFRFSSEAFDKIEDSDKKTSIQWFYNSFVSIVIEHFGYILKKRGVWKELDRNGYIIYLSGHFQKHLYYQGGIDENHKDDSWLNHLRECLVESDINYYTDYFFQKSKKTNVAIITPEERQQQ